MGILIGLPPPMLSGFTDIFEKNLEPSSALMDF